MKFVEKLPEARGGTVRWRAEAEALKERPGEWALIVTHKKDALAYAFARNINSGILRAFPRGEFKGAARKIDGEYHVYARYVGPS